MLETLKLSFSQDTCAAGGWSEWIFFNHRYLLQVKDM